MSFNVPVDHPIAPELVQNEPLSANWYKRLQWAYRYSLSHTGPEAEHLFYSEIGNFTAAAKKLLIDYIENNYKYVTNCEDELFNNIYSPFPPPYDIVDGIIYKVIQRGDEWKFYTKRFKQFHKLMDSIWSLGFESKFNLPFEAIIDHDKFRLVAQPLLPTGDDVKNILHNLTSTTAVSNAYLKLDIAEQLSTIAHSMNISFWPCCNPPPILFIEGYFHIMDYPRDAPKVTVDIAIPHFLNFCRDDWDVRFLRKELNVSKEGIKKSLDSNYLFPDVRHFITNKMKNNDTSTPGYKIKTLYPRHTWLFKTSIKLMERYQSFDPLQYMSKTNFMANSMGISVPESLSKTALLWQSQPYTYGPLGRIRSAFLQLGHPCNPICPIGLDGICINYQGQIQAAQLYHSIVNALNIDSVWSDRVKLWINHLHINHMKYDLVEHFTNDLVFYGDYDGAVYNYENIVEKMEGKMGRNGFWKLQLDLLTSIKKSGVDVSNCIFDFVNESSESTVFAKRAYELAFSTFINSNVDWALAASVMLYSTFLFYGKKFSEAIMILTSVVRSFSLNPAILIHITLLLVQCHFKNGNYLIGSQIADEAIKSYGTDVATPQIIVKFTFLTALMKSRMNRADKIAALGIFKSLYYQLKSLHPDFIEKTLLLIREVLQLMLDLCTEQTLKNIRTILNQYGTFTLSKISDDVESSIDLLCKEILSDCESSNMNPIEWVDRNLIWGKIYQMSSVGHNEAHVKLSLRVLSLFKNSRIENALSQCDM